MDTSKEPEEILEIEQDQTPETEDGEQSMTKGIFLSKILTQDKLDFDQAAKDQDISKGELFHKMVSFYVESQKRERVGGKDAKRLKYFEGKAAEVKDMAQNMAAVVGDICDGFMKSLRQNMDEKNLELKKVVEDCDYKIEEAILRQTQAEDRREKDLSERDSQIEALNQQIAELNTAHDAQIVELDKVREREIAKLKEQFEREFAQVRDTSEKEKAELADGIERLEAKRAELEKELERLRMEDVELRASLADARSQIKKDNDIEKIFALLSARNSADVKPDTDAQPSEPESNCGKL